MLDQHFWLNVSLVEDVKIQVKVNEVHLSLMYLDLLLQEGKTLNIGCVEQGIRNTWGKMEANRVK